MLTPFSILILIALLFGILSILPWVGGASHYLVALAVIILCIAVGFVPK